MTAHVRQALGAKAADYVYEGFAEDVDASPSEVEAHLPKLMRDFGFAFRKHRDEDIHDLLYHIGHAILRTILDDHDAWADASVSVHREVLGGENDLYLIMHWVAPTETGLSIGLLQEFVEMETWTREGLDGFIHKSADRVRTNCRLAVKAAHALGFAVPSAIKLAAE